MDKGLTLPEDRHMIVAKFRVCTHMYFFNVVVHDTTDALNKSIKRAQKTRSMLSPDEYRAVTHARKKIRVVPGKPDRVLPHIGTIHFSTDDLDVELIAHEATHMALHQLRILGVEILGAAQRTDEERLCNLVGEYSQAIHKTLHQLGLV